MVTPGEKKQHYMNYYTINQENLLLKKGDGNYHKKQNCNNINHGCHRRTLRRLDKI